MQALIALARALDAEVVEQAHAFTVDHRPNTDKWSQWKSVELSVSLLQCVCPAC